MFPAACGGHERQNIAGLGAAEQLRAAAEKQLLLSPDCTHLRTVEPSTKKDVPPRVLLHEKALLMVRCLHTKQHYFNLPVAKHYYTRSLSRLTMVA